MDPNATLAGDEGEDIDATRGPYLHSHLRLLFIFLLLGYGIMCLLSCALIMYLRVHRRNAFTGNQSAARRVILPAFEPLLIVLAVTTLIFSIYFATALATNLYAFNVSKMTTEIVYSGRQFVFLSVVVFMLQSSVSLSSLKKSMATTLVLATYTIPIVALLTRFATTNRQFYVAHTAARALLLLLYAYLFVKPPPRASKQSLREFCLYAFVYYALLFAYNARFYENDIPSGFLLTYASLLWGSLCPLVIWRVLLADTEHWRRLGQRAVALQQNLSSSLSSTVVSDSSRRGNILAHECITANGMHVLVELHRKFVIDFAYLELKHPIARGRCQRQQYADKVGDLVRPPMVVYRGVLRGDLQVAIKVYTPTQLDEDTIAQFAHEGALCGALRHPNVVHFVGLCVLPPTICIVNELCVGNLETVTRARQYKRDTASAELSQRQHLLINLTHMLDAARAIAYLHSFSPPFLHRNITPGSFLVDANGTVKLTHFGDSRSMVTRGSLSMATDTMVPSRRGQSSSSQSLDLSDLATPSPSSFLQTNTVGGWHPHVQTPSPGISSVQAMTIKGTVEYMAPELLLGHAGHACYDEAADVFALAVTMWDILYPNQPKYPLAGDNHFKIFAAVMAGERPLLGEDLPLTLHELLVTAWHQDPRLRPTVDTIVSALESLQEELMPPFAQRFMLELSAAKLLHEQRDVPSREAVTGIAAVDILVANGYADGESEALRLGNSLLDATVMHHGAHAKAFENSDEETYYFDIVRIRELCAASDPLVRNSRSQGRRTLSRSHGPKGSSVSSRSALELRPPSFFTNNDRRDHRTAHSRTKTMRRPPSAPVISRRERRDVPADPVALFCACRDLSQRWHQSSATRSTTRKQTTCGRSRQAETKLRKVKSSPVFDCSHLVLITGDDEMPETERMTDWEDFVLAIEDSENEIDEDTE